MPEKKTTTRIFIDESGTSDRYDPQVNNPGERFFTLAAAIVPQGEYTKLKQDFRVLREAYTKYIGEEEIKSRSIRRSNPANVDPSDPPAYNFWKYGEEGVKDYRGFCKVLETTVSDCKFKLISITTDKELAQALYPRKHVLRTCLTDLWERLVIYHIMNDVKKSRILYDPRQIDGDQVVKDSYQDFLNSGSWFLEKKHVVGSSLYERLFSPSSADSVGIQLADYCAYPIKRYQESLSYDFFKRVLASKLCSLRRDTRTGKRVEMGLKVSLNRTRRGLP